MGTLKNNSGGSDTPAVAVVGCGRWGVNLARNFMALGALKAVCDSNRKHADAQAELYGVQALTFDEVKSDSAITGIVIAVPAAQHYSLACKCLDADKHVFVEKPLSLRVRDAEDLIQRAAVRERILMVGHLMQYHPAFLCLKDICKKGEIGNIQYLYSNRLSLGTFRKEENALWSFAPHDVSMILSLVDADIESVCASGSAFVHEDVADITVTNLRFVGGQTAHVFVSWLHPFREQRFVVVGEEGMMVFEDIRDWPEKLVFYPHKTNPAAVPSAPQQAKAEYIPLEPVEPLELECRHFLDCMRDGITPRTDGTEGAKVLRVLDAAQKSLTSGNTVLWNELYLENGIVS